VSPYRTLLASIRQASPQVNLLSAGCHLLPLPRECKGPPLSSGDETLYLLGGGVSRHLSDCLYGPGDLFFGTENAKGKTHCPSGEGANSFVS
jgi:hypothetical protein